jgi:hypothetical protein
METCALITFDERSPLWCENQNAEIIIGEKIEETTLNEVIVSKVLSYFEDMHAKISGFQCFTLANIYEELGMPIPNYYAHEVAWFSDSNFTYEYHVEDSLVKDGKQRYIIKVYGADILIKRIKKGGVAPCDTKKQ